MVQGSSVNGSRLPIGARALYGIVAIFCFWFANRDFTRAFEAVRLCSQEVGVPFGSGVAIAWFWAGLLYYAFIRMWAEVVLLMLIKIPVTKSQVNALLHRIHVWRAARTMVDVTIAWELVAAMLVGPAVVFFTWNCLHCPVADLKDCRAQMIEFGGALSASLGFASALRRFGDLFPPAGGKGAAG
jgi:hypothetical protein